MKGTMFSFLVSLIFVVHGNVFAQWTDQKESQIKLQQQAAVQRLRIKLAQQQSQIAELKQQLAERDTELHSLLRLISTQSNQPAHSDARPAPNTSNDNDDDDDSNDSCNDPLYARYGSMHHKRGQASYHRNQLPLNPHSQERVTQSSTSGVPKM